MRLYGDTGMLTVEFIVTYGGNMLKDERFFKPPCKY
jgi:hypothetical protein